MGLCVTVALLCVCLSALDGAAVQRLPSTPYHQRVTTVAQRKYAHRVVQSILAKEIDKALQIANVAEAKLQAARQAVAVAQQSAHASHQQVESKSSVVAHLRKEVERLTREKNAAEYAKDAAKKAAEHAEHSEKAAAEQLEKAKQRADTARILAEAHDKEAKRARLAADRAQQESTDFIPAGQPQTEIFIVNSNAQTLHQEAVYAENLAHKARQEAEHYRRLMSEAQKHSTRVWIDSSRVFEEHRVKVAVYDSKCEALANTQAAFVKANMELQAAKAHWTPYNDALFKAEENLDIALEKAGEYWAVYRAMVQLTECPTRIPAVIRLPAQTQTQGGGGSSSEENNQRQQAARAAANGGGSSSEENNGGGEQAARRATNRGGSWGKANRAAAGRQAARAATNGGGSSSEENNRAGVARQAARGAPNGGGSSEERNARPQAVQRSRAPWSQAQNRPYYQPASAPWSQRAYSRFPMALKSSGRQQSSGGARRNRDSSEGD